MTKKTTIKQVLRLTKNRETIGDMEISWEADFNEPQEANASIIARGFNDWIHAFLKQNNVDSDENVVVYLMAQTLSDIEDPDKRYVIDMPLEKFIHAIELNDDYLSEILFEDNETETSSQSAEVISDEKPETDVVSDEKSTKESNASIFYGNLPGKRAHILSEDELTDEVVVKGIVTESGEIHISNYDGVSVADMKSLLGAYPLFATNPFFFVPANADDAMTPARRKSFERYNSEGLPSYEIMKTMVIDHPVRGSVKVFFFNNVNQDAPVTTDDVTTAPEETPSVDTKVDPTTPVVDETPTAPVADTIDNTVPVDDKADNVAIIDEESNVTVDSTVDNAVNSAPTTSGCVINPFTGKPVGERTPEPTTPIDVNSTQPVSNEHRGVVNPFTGEVVPDSTPVETQAAPDYQAEVLRLTSECEALTQANQLLRAKNEELAAVNVNAMTRAAKLTGEQVLLPTHKMFIDSRLASINNNVAYLITQLSYSVQHPTQAWELELASDPVLFSNLIRYALSKTAL